MSPIKDPEKRREYQKLRLRRLRAAAKAGRAAGNPLSPNPEQVSLKVCRVETDCIHRRDGLCRRTIYIPSCRYDASEWYRLPTKGVSDVAAKGH